MNHHSFANSVERSAETRVCPNCGQWQRFFNGIWDCYNQCAKRGFAWNARQLAEDGVS
jgi:ribosomal protein L37AE/L43A